MKKQYAMRHKVDGEFLYDYDGDILVYESVEWCEDYIKEHGWYDDNEIDIVEYNGEHKMTNLQQAVYYIGALHNYKEVVSIRYEDGSKKRFLFMIEGDTQERFINLSNIL